MAARPPPPGPQTSLSCARLAAAFSSPSARIQSYAEPPARGSSSSNKINSIAWNCVGSHIATASHNTLRVWRPEQPNFRGTVELRIVAPGSRHPAASKLTGTEVCRFNPRGPHELASLGNAGSEGTLRLWDIRGKGSPVAACDVGGKGYSCVYHPSGNHLVVGRTVRPPPSPSRPSLTPPPQDDHVMLYDLRYLPSAPATLTLAHSTPQPVQTNHTAFTNAGHELLYAAGDGTLRLLAFPSLAPLHALPAHAVAATVVAPAPHGHHLATGGADATVHLVDPAELLVARSLTAPRGVVRSLAFSFDGVYLAAGGDEPAEAPDGARGVPVWHAESGELVHTVPGVGGAPQVAWHPTSYALALADAGGLKIALTAGA